MLDLFARILRENYGYEKVNGMLTIGSCMRIEI